VRGSGSAASVPCCWSRSGMTPWPGISGRLSAQFARSDSPQQSDQPGRALLQKKPGPPLLVLRPEIGTSNHSNRSCAHRAGLHRRVRGARAGPASGGVPERTCGRRVGVACAGLRAASRRAPGARPRAASWGACGWCGWTAAATGAASAAPRARVGEGPRTRVGEGVAAVPWPDVLCSLWPQDVLPPRHDHAR